MEENEKKEKEKEKEKKEKEKGKITKREGCDRMHFSFFFLSLSAVGDEARGRKEG